jgi:hypothetical protein
MLSSCQLQKIAHDPLRIESRSPKRTAKIWVYSRKRRRTERGSWVRGQSNCSLRTRIAAHPANATIMRKIFLGFPRIRGETKAGKVGKMACKLAI